MRKFSPFALPLDRRPASAQDVGRLADGDHRRDRPPGLTVQRHSFQRECSKVLAQACKAQVGLSCSQVHGSPRPSTAAIPLAEGRQSAGPSGPRSGPPRGGLESRWPAQRPFSAFLDHPGSNPVARKSSGIGTGPLKFGSRASGCEASGVRHATKCLRSRTINPPGAVNLNGLFSSCPASEPFGDYLILIKGVRAQPAPSRPWTVDVPGSRQARWKGVP